jgi:hypothetical protein
VTLADRAGCVLVVAAGVFAATQWATVDRPGLALAIVVAALALAACQAMSWTQSRTAARTVLQHDSSGGLRLSVGGRAATDVVLGPSTRVLGPSVFLDLCYALDGRRRRCLRWLLPCDVPSDVLRRWTVVLPSAACVARS